MNPSQDRAVDDLLATSRLIVTVGTGGVGKTTTAAALAVRAAYAGRRVLVFTVDPARRLADALAVSSLPADPALVSLEGASGRLWAMMADTSLSWDRLVERCSPDRDLADELLANPLYRSLTKNFVQSHDYIALDHLCEFSADDRFDLVIVDTPPSGHVLDLLDAPGRMVEFFNSRLLDVLTGGRLGRSVGQFAAQPFLQLARRILGTDFLAQVSRLFTLLRGLGPAFGDRAALVEDILARPETSFVAVTTTSPRQRIEHDDLVGELAKRSIELDLLVLNRSLRAVLDPTDSPGVPGSADGSNLDFVDGELAAAVRRWRQLVDNEVPISTEQPSVAVALNPAGFDGIDGLRSFFV